MTDGKDLVRRVWNDDWAGRILDWCKMRGYGSLSEFLRASPAVSYFELSNSSGLEAAPIQLIAMQFSEARQFGDVRDAARDCLCRSIIEKFPEGWGKGADPEWQRALALSTWSAHVLGAGGTMLEVEPFVTCIMLALGKSVIPSIGWRPQSAEDPLLCDVFDQYWPRGNLD